MSRKKIKEDPKLVHLRRRLYLAASRDRPKTIEVDEYQLYDLGVSQGWKCALTNRALQFKPGRGKKNPYICTIDRINSKKGYVKGNVQLVTWISNWAKGEFTKSQFVKMCKDVCAASGVKK
jgi:hypothetical protein